MTVRTAARYIRGVVADRERESQISLLARRGFGDPGAAAALLGSEPFGELGRNPLVLDALSRCADPDLALATLGRLLEASPDPQTLRATLASSMPLRDRLLGVLGVSSALGDFVVRHPDSWHVLEEFEVEDLTPDADRFRALMFDAVGVTQAGPNEPPVAGITGLEAQNALRIAYRRALLALTARDVAASADLSTVTADLADLAGATLSAALAVARAEDPASAAKCRLAVIGMGKCGARELNYVSDVDVVFVAEPVRPQDGGETGADVESDAGSGAGSGTGVEADAESGAGPETAAGLVAGSAASAAVRSAASPAGAAGPAAKPAEGAASSASAAAPTSAAAPASPTAPTPAAAPVSPAAPASAATVDDAEALRAATRLASRMMRLCSDSTSEGSIWQVDAGLRPEGKAGPLVRTLASHAAYYQRWAKTWEFQALLKARPVAGDEALGAAYIEMTSPMVWSAAAREHFVDDVQAMRRRVVDHATDALRRAPGSIAVDRELKLGPGGLRDVEFAVQLLQLVHGRRDETLRVSATLDALAALADGGYVGREDGAHLAKAYRFLRMLEHRIQLFRLERTHTMPDDQAALRRIGRSMGWAKDPAGELGKAWRAHAHEVRRLHEKLFYRPLLAAVARLDESSAATVPSGSGPTPRLSADAARARLSALGYANPAGALANIEALATGVSRRAAIQRTLLPVMLGWFADAPDPDAGLLAFRRVSDALGDTPWYLRSLRDEGEAAWRLARVLSCGGYVPDLLLRDPEAVALLSDTSALVPRSRAAIEAEMMAVVYRATSAEHAVAAVRAIRRRELFRIVSADLLGLLGAGADEHDSAPARVRPAVGGPAPHPGGHPVGHPVGHTGGNLFGNDPLDVLGRALTDVTAATIEAALAAVIAFRAGGTPGSTSGTAGARGGVGAGTGSGEAGGGGGVASGVRGGVGEATSPGDPGGGEGSGGAASGAGEAASAGDSGGGEGSGGAAGGARGIAGAGTSPGGTGGSGAGGGDTPGTARGGAGEATSPGDSGGGEGSGGAAGAARGSEGVGTGPGGAGGSGTGGSGAVGAARGGMDGGGKDRGSVDADVDVDDVDAGVGVAAGAVGPGVGVGVGVGGTDPALGEPLPTRLAVVAMGRFGGGELGYGSDADVIFVHEPRDGADEREATELAFELANELRRLLQAPGTDPPLLIDADLRPEGRQGPLVRSLASYAEYYKRWSRVWESQALLRAAPIAGDEGVGARFVELIDPIRYPDKGLPETDVVEIRRIKARMEAERLPRGADRALHTKLGPGGLSDVEWVAQLLQLRYGSQVPALRVTGTRAALAAAVEAGLMSEGDQTLLDDAWYQTTRMRNGITLVRGRSADQIPTGARDLAVIARYLDGWNHVGETPGNGWHAGGSADGGGGLLAHHHLDNEALLDAHRRRARRARSVFERLFYG